MSNRRRLLCSVVAVSLLFSLTTFAQSGRRARNVVLITIDGLRHQELFGGMDRALAERKARSGVEDPRALSESFWSDSKQDRRERLMPFFWKTLAPRGVVLGSGAVGARVEVTSPHRMSYPGYAEILTGQVQPAVTGNVPIRIPQETVLEFVRRKLDLKVTEVAAFTSWNHFPYIVEHQPGSIIVNAGGPLPESVQTQEIRRLAALEERTLSPWKSVRQNVFTESLAFAYLKKFQPTFVLLALDETDEWAHGRRYDRVLQAIRHFDETLRLLWELLQSLEAYRGKTTLLITTDHGRGRTPEDWTSHGKTVLGSEEIWIAIVGPDTPPRGIVPRHPPFELTQIAATILELFGLDPKEFDSRAGEPIPLALR